LFARAKFALALYYIVLFFVVNTYARSPVNYCNGIDSPPALLLEFDQNGKEYFLMNQDYQKAVVNQDEIFDIVERTSSSSALD